MTRTRPPGGIKNGRIKLYIDRGNFSIYGRTVWVTFSTDEYVIAKRRGGKKKKKMDGKYRIFFEPTKWKSNIWRAVRAKRWYNRADWPMPGGIALSASLSLSLSISLTFLLPPWNRQSLGIGTNRRETRTAVFMLVFLGHPRRHREKQYQLAAISNGRAGNELTRAIY